MYIDGYKVIINHEILQANKLQIESLIINGADDRIGMILLSEINKYVLRIYLVLKSNDSYYISHELQLFSFPSKDSLIDFRDKIPSMTALELLYWLNPMPTRIN